MVDDPQEHAYAGRFRDMQNWIGGRDYSPRNAVYVPPPPETVADYMADLVVFANRISRSSPRLRSCAYREGQVEPIIESFTAAATVADELADLAARIGAAVR